MQYSKQVRKKIKRECREYASAEIGRCVGVEFLFALPYALLMLILCVVMFGKLFVLSYAGYRGNILQQAAAEGGNSVWVVMFFMLLVTGPLQFGRMRFYIDLSRGREVEAYAVLRPFTSLSALWAGIRMEFNLFCRNFLWGLIPSFAWGILSFCISLMVYAVRLTYGQIACMLILSGIIYMLLMIPVNLKMLTYQAGWSLLHEREDAGAWDAAHRATIAFRGQYRHLFVFVLSFFWWYVLEGALLGGCGLLAWWGFAAIPGAWGFAVFLLAVIAGLCFELVLSGFLSAYFNASFFRLYDFFRSAETGDEPAPDACA